MDASSLTNDGYMIIVPIYGDILKTSILPVIRPAQFQGGHVSKHGRGRPAKAKTGRQNKNSDKSKQYLFVSLDFHERQPGIFEHGQIITTANPLGWFP